MLHLFKGKITLVKSFVLLLFLFSIFYIQAIPTLADSKSENKPKYDEKLFNAMQWRCIGPYRGGRSVAVAGHPDQDFIYYMGVTGGGIYKTEDAGMTWFNVSDSVFQWGSVGAIALAESDPNVVYVGMGETCLRGNISPGDGVYKSVDGGKTWNHIGLKETQFIGKVCIHPKDENIVFVAAMGHLFGTNPERGVFRSKDGGKTWQKVFFKNDKTGAVDMVFDPFNPRVVYVAMWEANRTPWGMSSSGPGSGLYKSTDGGDTWKELSKQPGLPKGILGKIGITASGAQKDRLWASVEANDGGIFISDDGGDSWRRVSEDRNLRQRAFYYSHIYADPKSPETVYVLNVGFHKSVDEGKTYTRISVPHGDNHDLWIDPTNSNRMINANDGGANVTFNGGQSWTEQDYATAQFYHVLVDDQFPYMVYGAQQDNSTVGTLSRTTGSGITTSDWHSVGGGESGYIAVKPDEPNIIYAGSYGGYLTRYNHRIKESRNIAIWPENPMGAGAADLKYRFQWTFPIMASPHDPDVLFATGNHVFKSTNEGQSWEEISPDLTRNDKGKQGPSGGPITKDNTSVEYYCTIFSFAESPGQKDLFWAGSDDGLIHISKDGGQNWQNITPKNLPEWALISIIEPSPFDPATAYVAATRYKLDDFKPYILKTNNYGKSWKLITNGIPVEDFTRVVREDPNKKGLLYAGTERGVYVSFDDGANWQSLQLNLPFVPIHDLVIQSREKDLVVATHGRSFWILDDLTPLHEMSDKVAKSDVHLFQPRHTYRMGGGSFNRPGMSIGQNPPAGVVIQYYLKEESKKPIKLEILNMKGDTIRTFSSKKTKEISDSTGFYGERSRSNQLATKAGMNRFIWNMRYPDAKGLPNLIMWAGTIRGPAAVPGKYQARLIVGDQTITKTFEILKDPRIKTTQVEFQEQFDLLINIRDKVTEAHEAVQKVRDIRKQTNEYVKLLPAGEKKKTIAKAAKDFNKKLRDVEEIIIQTKIKSNQDALNYPIKLNNKIAALTGTVASADVKPTKQMYDVFEYLAGKLDAQLEKLSKIIDEELPKFNQLVKENDIPAVMLKNK